MGRGVGFSRVLVGVYVRRTASSPLCRARIGFFSLVQRALGESNLRSCFELEVEAGSSSTRDPTMHRTIGIAVVILTASSLTLAADSAASDWPHWRGPTGNGVSLDGTPPTEWSDTKNVRWKVPIPGEGSGSPVVWRDRVFVVTAVAQEGPKESADAKGAGEASDRSDGDRGRGRSRRGRGGRRSRGGGSLKAQEFRLLCIDRATGDTKWSRTAVSSTPHQGHHADHGFASASPCTDGKSVFAHFGSRGLFCYSLDGELRWKRDDLGKMDTRNGFGEGSSPTVHGDRLIVPWDHQGPSYIAALNKTDGETIWKKERDEPTCWATPLIVDHGGKKLVIVNGENHARAYDFENGDELWRCAGQTARPVASPVAGHGLAFVGSGFRGSFLGAFQLGGKGDLEGTKGVAWSIDRQTPDIASLLLVGERLYFHAGKSGMISCYDARTGKPKYHGQRVDGIRGVYASPVAANGHVYLTGRSGTTVVLKDGDEFDVAATNSVGEPVDATPAIAGKELFIRGRSHLFAIAATDAD